MTANSNQVGNIPTRNSGKKNLSVREAKMFADKNAANEGRLQLKRGSRDHQQHPNHGNYAGTGPE